MPVLIMPALEIAGSENAGTGKCRYWKMPVLENAGTGKCPYWKMLGLENAGTGVLQFNFLIGCVLVHIGNTISFKNSCSEKISLYQK